MILTQVDLSDSTALHDQVAASIRRAIADGEVARGERLPTARDLGHALGVNANTVLRALRLLRDEGLVEFRRGRGITVTAGPDKGQLITSIRELLRLARAHGYSRRDLIRLIEETK